MHKFRVRLLTTVRDAKAPMTAAKLIEILNPPIYGAVYVALETLIGSGMLIKVGDGETATYNITYSGKSALRRKLKI